MTEPAYLQTIMGRKELLEKVDFDEVGYFITVRSDDDFTVSDVDGWIEDFRDDWNAKFRDMSDNDLRGIKVNAIEETAKRLVVAGSREEACEHWNEIMMEQYIFDRRERELDILRDMSLKELREWMIDLSMHDWDRRLRKLMSQVVGYDQVWDETPAWNEAQRRLNSDRSNIRKYICRKRRCQCDIFLSHFFNYCNVLDTLTYSLKYLNVL